MKRARALRPFCGHAVRGRGERRKHKPAQCQREILRHCIEQPVEVFMFADMLHGFPRQPCQPLILLLVRLLKVVKLFGLFDQGIFRIHGIQH